MKEKLHKLIDQYGYKRLFVLLLLWPFQPFFAFLQLLKSFAKKDSFFAKSLELFYLRQLKIIKSENLYIEEVGSINRKSFIYQSFLAIYLCYDLFGRKIYALGSIIALLIAYFYYLNGHSLISMSLILFIVAVSSVSYFLIRDRGNYQILPLVLSICSIMSMSENGLSVTTILLVFISSYLSISAAVLLVMFFALSFIGTFHILNIYLILIIFFSIGLLFVTNLYLLIKSKNTSLLSGAINTLKVIGFLKDDDKNVGPISLTRSFEIKKGIIASLPILLVIPIYYPSDLLLISFFICLVFLNQSKILRLWDYHFLFSFIFFYSAFLVGIQELSLLNIASLFLLGTNPIFMYAMDSYNENLTRGFIVSPIVAISHKQEKDIINGFKAFFFKSNPDSILIVPVNDKIQVYNDLWRKESLLLEWVWTSLEVSKIKYFPDWYSLFYSDNGFSIFHDLIYKRENLWKKDRLFLFFDEPSKAQSLPITSFFPDKCIETYFESLKGLHVTIRPK